MFTETDYNELRRIMSESPKKQELLSKLLESHNLEMSTLNHEIRNPLTLVYSTLQLIESSHPEVHTFKYWDSLHRDIEYMTQLLEEVSSYNNSRRLNVSDVDMESFLQSIVLSFAASVTDTNIEFISKIDPELPVVRADSIKLQAVLLNLLKNAREAISPHNGRPRISFHAHSALQPSGQFVTIEIADNGVGIPPEDLERIFEPFVTGKEYGTGLGLPVARRIIRAHGGTITVTSESGTGTVFVVTLPVQ